MRINKAYLILIYVFSPILYFAFYWAAYGESGIRYAYSTFISVWPIWLGTWAVLFFVVILYLRSPQFRPIVVYRYRTR